METKAFLLNMQAEKNHIFDDIEARNLSKGVDNSGAETTYWLWAPEWGPLTGKIARRIKNWRELTQSKQRVFIAKSSIKTWEKDMFVTANSPRRKPEVLASTTPAEPRQAPISSYLETDNDGCPPGTNRRKSRGLLGLFREDLGCISYSEYGQWRERMDQKVKDALQATSDNFDRLAQEQREDRRRRDEAEAQRPLVIYHGNSQPAAPVVIQGPTRATCRTGYVNQFGRYIQTNCSYSY